MSLVTLRWWCCSGAQMTAQPALSPCLLSFIFLIREFPSRPLQPVMEKPLKASNPVDVHSFRCKRRSWTALCITPFNQAWSAQTHVARKRLFWHKKGHVRLCRLSRQIILHQKKKNQSKTSTNLITECPSTFSFWEVVEDIGTLVSIQRTQQWCNGYQCCLTWSHMTPHLFGISPATPASSHSPKICTLG